MGIKAGSCEISLQNAGGQTVLNKAFQYAQGEVISEHLDVSALPAGNYILSIRSEGQTFTRQVFITP